MSTYNCAIRTNYFRVKDEEKFKTLMDRVYTGSDEKVKVFTKVCEDNTKRFAFGCLHEIAGLKNAKDDIDPESNESAYDEFVSGLQDCVAEGDAIVLYESGHEKLCCVTAYATVITATESKFINLFDTADLAAAALLGDPNWHTQRVY